MFPWIWWYWAPRVQYPLSGNVTQEMVADLFFAAIKSGDAAIEKQAFDSASYGKQLGWLSEVLLHQAGSTLVSTEKAVEARAKLEHSYRAIEAIKAEHMAAKVEQATKVLQQLKQSDPAAFQLVLSRLGNADG